MRQETMIHDMTKGPIGKQLLMFALPFILANLLQTVYSFTDMIVVGHSAGSSGVSGISVSSNVIWVLTAAIVGFSTGIQVLIAQLSGIRDRAGISRTIGTAFTAVFVLAIVFGLFGIFASGWLLQLLNTPDAAFREAKNYLIICSCGMIFIYGYNLIAGILRGMGDSVRPLLFVAIAAVINIVLDLVLVSGFQMGCAGAALATVIGQAVSFLFSLLYLIRRRDAFGFDFRRTGFVPDSKKLRQILRLGAPLAFQQLIVYVSVLVITAFINDYGLVASSIYGISNKLFSVINIATAGTMAAASTMVGQNFAVGKTNRVKTVIYWSMLIDIGFAVLVGILVILFPKAVFGLFSSDPEVLAQARRYAIIQAVFFLTEGMLMPGAALGSGIGNVSLSLTVAVLDCVVGRIGICLLLDRVFLCGLTGLYWGNAAGPVFAILCSYIYFFSGVWKKWKALVSNPDT